LIKQAHNEFLGMLAETGLVGAAIFLGFWFLLIRGAFGLWRGDSEHRTRNAFTLGFLVSFLAVSLASELLIPRTPTWIAPAAMWWTMIGLVFHSGPRAI
jgi:O-antigen ligase